MAMRWSYAKQRMGKSARLKRFAASGGGAARYAGIAGVIEPAPSNGLIRPTMRFVRAVRRHTKSALSFTNMKAFDEHESGNTVLLNFRMAALLSGTLALAAALAVASPGLAQDRPSNGASTVEVSDEGREIYEQICQSCHMPDAKGGGVPGAMFPALAGNPRLKDKDYGSIILLKGRGGMPWFTDILTRPQIAAVLNYVRGHFNDYQDTVAVADLDRITTANPPVPDCNCGH